MSWYFDTTFSTKESRRGSVDLIVPLVSSLGYPEGGTAEIRQRAGTPVFDFYSEIR